MTGLRALAAWTGPVLVGLVAARVCAGDPDAPPLVLAAAVAPLVALLQPRRPPAPPAPAVAAPALAGSVALVLCASLTLLGEAAALLGARHWQGVIVAAALALLVTLTPTLDRWRGAALAAAGAALLATLVVAGVGARMAPWTAWRETAARPALVFGAGSAWVGAGGHFPRRTTLTFTEGHRLVAVEPGTFRVAEDDGARRVVREWRLAAGDALNLRPGDRLVAEAGSRLRFEAGKRVPGAPPSGAAWAAAAGRERAVAWLGTLATLGLGAVALLPGVGRRAAAAPALALVAALGAACWGLYAVTTAPELAMGGSVAAPLLRLLPAAAPLVAAAMLALFLATAGALRERLGAVAGARTSAVWTAVVVAAAAGALALLDPWTAWSAGLGLAASAVAAPRLAAGEDAGRVLGRPVEAIGALVGGAIFVALTGVALAGATARLPTALAPLGAAPVLAAAPVAWVIVRFLRGRR